MNKKIILASQSPRRKEILMQVRIPFTVRVGSVDETAINEQNPEEKVKKLATLKAKSVPIANDEIVIAADTVVSYAKDILEKPENERDAKNMLMTLSSKTHDVYTGVTLRTTTSEKTFVEKTEVTFYPLSETEIDDYIESGEPFDKAGAYGIQGLGATLVKEINGDYFNVVGLPIARLVRELRSMLLNN